MTSTQKDFMTTLLFNMQIMSDNNSVLASILDECEFYDERYYVYKNDDIKIYDYMTDILKCYVQANGGGFMLTTDAARLVDKAVDLMDDYRRSPQEISKILSNMETDPRFYRGSIVWANFSFKNPKKPVLECSIKQPNIILKYIPEYFNVDNELFNSYKRQYGQATHV